VAPKDFSTGDGYQCPTCGRVRADWANEDTKGQAVLIKTKMPYDLLAEYRTWRRGFGNKLYASDIDQIEWRIVDGIPVPVALIEMTRVTGTKRVPVAYLESVLKRYTVRDPKSQLTINAAAHMGIDAYLVIYRENLEDFWVYNLTWGGAWQAKTQQQYRDWVSSLDRKSL